MKKSFWLFASVILLSVVFTTTSCNEDDGLDPPPVNDTPPSIILDTQPPTELSELGSQFTVGITVTKGDNPIKSITIQENGVNLDASRVDLDGFGANPIALFDANKEGLTWDNLVITASDQCGFYTYTIIAEDDNAYTSQVSFDIDINAETAPTVTFTNPPSVGVGAPSQVIDLKINGVKGEIPLSTVTILEDGFAVDASRVTMNSIAENPISVIGDDVDGFDWTIQFAAQAEFDTRTYTVELADECGLTSEITFTLTVESGTAISMELNGVLFNQSAAGPKGALDLDDGNTCGVTTTNPDTGTAPADAEIRDMGIDLSQPVADNWREQMGPMNDATMRVVDLTQVEGFTFDAVTTIEEIAGAYDTGIDLTEMVNGNLATSPVSEGDLLVVRRNGKDYLIRIDIITKTIDDNDDSYTLSIKY